MVKLSIIDNAVIQHQNMQCVQHLPLILVQALGLYVEDEVRDQP